MTSVTERAATRLLRSIEGYLSWDPTDTTAKFTPVDSRSGADGRPASLAAVFTAQQFLDRVPFFLACDGGGVGEDAAAAEEGEVRGVARFLAEAVSSHLRRYERSVGSCGERGYVGASHRGAWIAWVALFVYRRFAAEAASDAKDWVLRAYKSERQILADLLNGSGGDRGGDAAVPPRTTSEVLREMHRALEEREAEHGPDAFRDPTNLFGAFVKDITSSALPRCLTRSQGRMESGEVGAHTEGLSAGDVAARLFPFHPLAPGFAARQAAAVCLTSFVGPGSVPSLVQAVRKHLQAHEDNVQRLARSGCEARAGEVGAAACAYRDAIRRGLSHVRSAVQVITTSVYSSEEVVDGCDDGDGGGEDCLPGMWLVESTRSHQQSQRRRIRLLLPPRQSLCLPGLGIAATEILLTGDTRIVGKVSEAPPVPRSVAAVSTFLVAPPEARSHLLWRQPDGACENGAVTVPATSLHRVAALYMITELPPTGDVGVEGREEWPASSAAASSRWWTALESEVRCVNTGVVLIVTQATFSREALRRLERCGNSSRTVVALGSVGEWGLTQLGLRFNSMPNYGLAGNGAGDKEEGIPYRFHAATGSGGVGVLVLPLDEVFLTRECTPNRGNKLSPLAMQFVESHRRLLVVIGECERPKTTLMSMRPEPESSSSSSSNSSSSGSDCDSTSTDSFDAQLPPVSHVRCCVLLGGTTPPLQSERLVAFHQAFESLSHRLTLPTRLSQELLPAPAVELAVLSRLDDVLSARGSRVAPDGDDDSSYFRYRAAKAFREAIWECSLICERRRLGGGAVEVAWAALCQQQQQQWKSATAGDVAHQETYLQVRAAYWTVGQCLDELCRTALWFRSRPPHDGGGAAAVRATPFAPIIR